MAAGRGFVSASREQVASRRPTRAPFFNEKEYISEPVKNLKKSD
jgi:hypothetical protein